MADNKVTTDGKITKGEARKILTKISKAGSAEAVRKLAEVDPKVKAYLVQVKAQRDEKAHTSSLLTDVLSDM